MAFRRRLETSAPDRPERLEADYFARSEPEELLYDENESLWAAIVDKALVWPLLVVFETKPVERPLLQTQARCWRKRRRVLQRPMESLEAPILLWVSLA